jgi:hypothetical protein
VRDQRRTDFQQLEDTYDMLDEHVAHDRASFQAEMFISSAATMSFQSRGLLLPSESSGM